MDEQVVDRDPVIEFPSAGTNPVADATWFSDSFAPLSMMKLLALLEHELGSPESGSASFLVPRARYYGEIAARARRIRARTEERFAAYTDAYSSYRRRSDGVDLFCFLAAVAQGAATAALVLLGALLWMAHKTGFPVPHVVVPLFWASIVVAVPAQIPLWLRDRATKRLAAALQTPAAALDEQLTREFHAVLLELLGAASDQRLDPYLVSAQAPTLVEIESARIIPSATFRAVEDFLQRHVTSAVGLAGPRGAGKSTLLRWLVYALDGDWIPVYLTAPASYDAVDFMRVIFSETASAIISRYEADTAKLRRRRLAEMITVFRPRPAADDIVLSSYRALEMLAGTRTNQRTTTAGLAGKGISLQRDRQTSWAERERTHPELTAAFKRYLEDYQRHGGRRVVIAVDELDKLTSADEAITAINGLKDLFHLPNTHFVVSVSADALRRFAMRGIPVRDVFDSAFDEIVRIQPPSPEEAWKMLAYRVSGFPTSIALFCYAWAGGLPRDIIRTARACVAMRRQANTPVRVADVAPLVVRQDITDAIDAAVSAGLEGEPGLDVAALTRARRALGDGLTRALLPEADPGDTAAPSHGAVMQQGLSVYADLGATVAEFFGPQFDARLAADPGKVFAVVADLARARAELASYPPEAQWWLGRVEATLLDQWPAG